MCLIAFALDGRADVPLLLAANRDEFFERPTAALHRWALPDGTQVLSGRDLREGGTWLGVSMSGRVAMLTNVRSADMPATRRSRGELATRWLGNGFADAPALAQAIAPQAYGGFNLVVGDLHQGSWTFISNRNPADPHGSEAPALWQRPLGPGVYALSNASLNTDWPKTRRLRSALFEALEQAHGPDGPWQPPLCQALGDHRPVPDEALPITGVSGDWERALASPFVRMPQRGYGTRSSLLMGVWREGAHRTVSMDEWQHETDSTTHAVPSWRTATRLRERLLLRS